MVRRIFSRYLSGVGIFAIAERLNRDTVPSPSAADPQRNRHRAGAGWAKSAVKAILANPATPDAMCGTGSWNDPDTWVWSDTVVHEPRIGVEDFETAQPIAAVELLHDRGCRQFDPGHQRADPPVPQPAELRGVRGRSGSNGEGALGQLPGAA